MSTTNVKAVPPVLIVSSSLSYEIVLPESSRIGGNVGERGPVNGQRSRFVALTGDECRFAEHAMVKREFENVLHANDVLYDDSNRADLGPLPGRYEGHPWAVRLMDAIAIEVECMELLATIPASVRLQCYHNGEGDDETVALLPFDGWESVDRWVSRKAGPWNEDKDCYGKDCSTSDVLESFVGADVVRIMRAKEAASPAQCRGELRWRIDSNALCSEAEAARVRKQVEAIRTGASMKQIDKARSSMT
jgi:hypothetical protein